MCVSDASTSVKLRAPVTTTSPDTTPTSSEPEPVMVMDASTGASFVPVIEMVTFLVATPPF